MRANSLLVPNVDKKAVTINNEHQSAFDLMYKRATEDLSECIYDGIRDIRIQRKCIDRMQCTIKM